ncbi:MAG: N-acetylneuraminate lyase [Bacteroidales bacterium]|nr:N-acetylneuraminate lyase [Bacteroidales bacterium]
MERNKLTGLIAAPFTPMYPCGNINLSAIQGYADWLVKTGIAGVFICGTTGEGVSMTVEERCNVTREWVRASAGRLKVIVHVGTNCQADAMALAKNAQEEGADAIASMAPNFFKPSNVNDLVGWFEPVAAAAPELPFYYYNMPSMTGVYLPVEDFLVEGGKRIPTLAGVKFTHNNLMEMNQCISLEGGRFEVLHGYDEILICGLALGTKAAVGSTYNYAGVIYSRLMKCFEEGNLEMARELQKYSVEIVKVIIKYGGGIRGGKAIMKLIGIDCGECRLPITKFTDSEYAELKSDLDNIDFFEKCIK